MNIESVGLCESTTKKLWKKSHLRILIDVHLMIAKLNVKLPSQRLIPGGNWRKLAEIVDVEISGMLPIKFQ